MKTRIIFIITAFSVLILTSCGGAPAPEAPAVEEPAAEEPAVPDERTDELYVLETAIWASNIINLCWENPDQINQTERVLIQTAIKNTWEAVSLVDFIGWGECTNTSRGIRIQISDESSHTKKLGANIDGLQNGMVLNITFTNWGCVEASGNQTPCVFPYNGYTREDFIRIIAVHEFGHALSFSHEQNRTDTPSWCDKPQGPDGTMPIGGWDLDSVMNYCNSLWVGNGSLSTTDIAGIQMIYGAYPWTTTKNDYREFYYHFQRPRLLD